MQRHSNRTYNRLLLIDDEPGIRKMMAMDLNADGYRVFTAADGESGLSLFEERRPHIVLTDLKMPGMDGIEVLKRIKDKSPETEVIVITGHGDLELAIQSLQLDASDFITKPVDNRALELALERAAERLCLKRELKAHTEDLERKVTEATAKVLQSERLAAVGQTVSSLVHSLKNMMVGLKGGAYMIRQGRIEHKDDMCDNGLEMLERNLRRVSALVTDLLTLSKPRKPEVMGHSIAALAAEAVESMKPAAGDKSVELTLAQGAPRVSLLCEGKAVLDCLQNLICNGIDAASESEAGRVELRVRADDQEVVFTVTDNGPGLDPEAEERIFEGFFSTKGAAGTGLGLMVTQKNAREHGGRVEYDSRPGEGASFRLILPLEGGPACLPGKEGEQ